MQREEEKAKKRKAEMPKELQEAVEETLKDISRAFDGGRNQARSKVKLTAGA